ncbi:MAG: alpha-galactosidase, partial [Eubacterium sp.]|nr:alpha-galactosidase [Eubacterium sp.]
YLITYADRGFSGNPYCAGKDRTCSLDVLPQEFPCKGNGDYRSTALIMQNTDGSCSVDLRYESHRIYPGKYGLPGLPAVYADESESETLEITMRDPVTEITAVLYYGVIPDTDIITRAVKVTNGGTGRCSVEKLQSACLDFLYGDFETVTFYGRHTMERNLQRQKVGHGQFVIESRRGNSGHQYNPMMILCRPETTEEAGDCYAMNFVYSGGFSASAEKDQMDQTRCLMGLMTEDLSYPLSADESLYGPEVILTYSDRGFQQLSHNLHRIIRDHIIRGPYKDAKRAVLINSWEACYFDFTGETVIRLAEEAAALDIEMLVLDDGWFGKRNDDYAGLGDWYVNEEKLGMTLSELVGRVKETGLKFGIWIEPEMVSEDSDLYRAHPDWAMTIPGRDPVRSRYQLVLDFSRGEVVDAIFAQLCALLDQADISYVKWDYNRCLCDVYSRKSGISGNVQYDYILGVYDLLERLLKRYPDLLIEGCAGGGGRFDAGMMYYTPQIWCSDNTDAIDRVKIQYGSSFGYPVSVVGSHVSAVPNHQTRRSTPFETRAAVAMAGTFGYELCPSVLSEKIAELIRSQVREYHEREELIRKGLYYRLSDPFKDPVAAWCFVSEDRKEAFLCIVMLECHANPPQQYVRLRGLLPEGEYRNDRDGLVYRGEALMKGGLPVPAGEGEYASFRMYFRITE